jgi:hypothetical protein
MVAVTEEYPSTTLESTRPPWLTLTGCLLEQGGAVATELRPLVRTSREIGCLVLGAWLIKEELHPSD